MEAFGIVVLKLLHLAEGQGKHRPNTALVALGTVPVISSIASASIRYTVLGRAEPVLQRIAKQSPYTAGGQVLQCGVSETLVRILPARGIFAKVCQLREDIKASM